MLRGFVLAFGSVLIATAACSAERSGPLTTTVKQGDDDVAVHLNSDGSVDINVTSDGFTVKFDEAEEGTSVATDFVDLCKITKDVHLESPASGNRSTSSSNGTTISVLGSRSQSISSVNGKAVIAVTGAAVLHLTFPNGDLASIETNASADKVEITVDGPDAIFCKAVS